MASPYKMKGMSFGNSPMQQDKKRKVTPGKEVKPKFRLSVGTLTDGNNRRAFLKGTNYNNTVKNIYKKNPIKLLREKVKVKYVKSLMLKNKIDFLPIVNNKNKFLSFVTWDQLEKKKKKKNKK